LIACPLAAARRGHRNAAPRTFQPIWRSSSSVETPRAVAS